MHSVLNRFSEHRQYQLVSIPLTLASIIIPLVVVVLGGSEWLAFASGLPLYAALVLLTYYRLTEAGLSSGWLTLMIFIFHMGPKRELSESIAFYPSGLIFMVPVAMAWLVPARRIKADARAGA